MRSILPRGETLLSTPRTRVCVLSTLPLIRRVERLRAMRVHKSNIFRKQDTRGVVDPFSLFTRANLYRYKLSVYLFSSPRLREWKGYFEFIRGHKKQENKEVHLTDNGAPFLYFLAWK